MKSAIASIVLAAPLLVHAAPPKYVTKNYTSGFEYDSNGAILSANVPGPYNGLQWDLNVGPFTYAAGFCVDVCPSTFPVYVQFNVTDAPRSASVSTAYKGSKVVDFTLNQFDFGCTAPAQYYPTVDQTYDIPANCTLTVHGFKTAPKPGVKADVSTTFKYIPNIQPAPETSFPSAQMTTAKLPTSFTGLKFVSFNATLLRGANKTYYAEEPIVRLDTFHYITRNLTTKA